MKNLVALALTLLCLAACQGHDVTKEQVIVRDQRNGLGGTDSTGGGNGVDGKPLESYAVNIEANADYKTHIAPVIAQVVKKFPRFASDLIHVSVDRRWYLLPVELDKIPHERIGVAFAVDQLALQSRAAVWIDDKQFRKMPNGEDRAKLLLHELVMGIRMMEFQGGLNQCLSGIAIHRVPNYSEKKYSDLRDDCFRKFGGVDGIPGVSPRMSAGIDVGTGTGITLTPDDYDNIRELTLMLWESKGDISALEVANFLKGKNFRRY